jgi:cell division protein FtsB
MKNSDQQKSQELHEKRQRMQSGAGKNGDSLHQRRTEAAREIKKLENGEFGRKVDIEREQR